MYDFENGQLPDGERRTYKLIRWWLLDCYYSYCRTKLHLRNLGTKEWEWSVSEHEVGYAYEQCEYCFDRPIEQLMLEVLTLILNAGRGPITVDSYHRRKIAAVLEKNDLHKMLHTLPAEERSEFEHDLKLLYLM